VIKEIGKGVATALMKEIFIRAKKAILNEFLLMLVLRPDHFLKKWIFRLLKSK
jgi:hypothetical protein